MYADAEARTHPSACARENALYPLEVNFFLSETSPAIP